MTVLEEDFSTIAATPLLRADYSGDFGGTGGGSGTTHDYVPYELDANASDLDTAILALSPFGYYPLDDASGNPQDASGNARHGTAHATLTYQTAALSTKAGQSLQCVDGYFTVPSPRARLSDPTLNFSLMALCMLVDEAGGRAGSGGPPVGVYAVIGHDLDGNANYNLMWHGTDDVTFVTGGDGGMTDFVHNQPYPKSHICAKAQGIVTIGQAFVLAIRGRGSSVEYWVNGALIASSLRVNLAITQADLAIGGTSGSFWKTMQTRWSNLATFAVALTDAQLKTATEAMADAAIFAAAFTP